MVKLIEIKTCTAFWEIDGAIMRFQRRKRIADEQTGLKIAQYRDLLFDESYKKCPEKLCEIATVLDEIMLVRIGFEIYHDHFLRMFEHYAKCYISLWAETNKVVKAKKISIFPVFELMFKHKMTDKGESQFAILKRINNDKIFLNIFEQQFSLLWIRRIQDKVSCGEDLDAIRRKIGVMRVTTYLMRLPEKLVTQYLEIIAQRFTRRRELITGQKFYREILGKEASTTTENYNHEFVRFSADVVSREFQIQSGKFIVENPLELNMDSDRWRLYWKHGPSIYLDTVDFTAVRSPSLKLEIKYFMKQRFFSLTGNTDKAYHYLIEAANIFVDNNPNIHFFADIDDVDIKSLQMSLEHQYKQDIGGKNPSGIARTFSILTVITNYLMGNMRDAAMKSPVPHENPFSKYRIHNAKEYKKRTPAIPEMVMDEIDRHTDEIDPLYRLIYRIFSNTGMRSKEALFLEADCIEKSRYENLVQLKYKPYKTLSARRRAGIPDYHKVLIPAALANEISRHIEMTAEWRAEYGLPYIFINKRPNFRASMLSMRNFQLIIDNLIKKHDIRDESGNLWHFTCKQQRKTLAVKLIENGATIEELAYWLGHLTRTTASNYYAEVRKMKLAELNTEFFRKRFDLILSNEQLAEYTLEERKLLYMDFRLEQRRVEFGYCLKKMADGGCTNRNSLYNCVNCKNLCTGKKYLPYWRELLSDQQFVVNRLLAVYDENGIADYHDFKEYRQARFLLQCYENVVDSIENGASR